MIAFVEGVLVEKHPTRVVLNAAGLGYEILIPLSSYDKLGRVGEKCHILTHDYVKEDAHLLYGFASPAEREMFELLIGISGIGPKLALSTLSGMTVREIKASIVEEDIKRLSSISGLGRKTAERIVVELRDKLSKGEALEAVAGAGEATESDTRMRDAVMALVSLGYKQDAAQKMVRQVLAKEGGEETVEEIVKQALTT